MSTRSEELPAGDPAPPEVRRSFRILAGVIAALCVPSAVFLTWAAFTEAWELAAGAAGVALFAWLMGAVALTGRARDRLTYRLVMRLGGYDPQGHDAAD